MLPILTSHSAGTSLSIRLHQSHFARNDQLQITNEAFHFSCHSSTFSTTSETQTRVDVNEFVRRRCRFACADRNLGKAITSFFTPASQKKPEKLTWRIVDKSLIIGKYVSDIGKRALRKDSPVPCRLAVFDLDDTLITTSSGSRWARSATSWKWWDISVPTKIKALHKEGYQVIIISNQGSISLKDNPKALQKDSLSLANFKDQVTAVLRQLDLPVSIYAATMPDKYRKPRVGMWEEMLEDYDLDPRSIVDWRASFYVGDAAGREKTEKHPKDHASSDR